MRRDREQHSSRRQQHLQQLRRSSKIVNNNANANEHSLEDIECTAHRVASVTLNTESDSRSADVDVPLSFRSKRRKRVTKKEKQMLQQQNLTTACVEMEVDEHQPPWKKHSVVNMADGITTCKQQMDWDNGGDTEGSSFVAIERPDSVLRMENQSDHLSFSDSDGANASNVDADDEQSDWPGNEIDVRHVSMGVRPSTSHLIPCISATSTQRDPDAKLSGDMIKKIEHFLLEPNERELLLDQVYRTSAVKQLLRGHTTSVQIVKRGRGTVALRKG